MIVGTGIDIVELDRIEGMIQRHKPFVHKICTELERQHLELISNDQRKVEYIAGRFAAKEAISKALQTGIGTDFSWHDVSILHHASGAPFVCWHRARSDTYRCHLSISHSNNYAVAQAIIENRTPTT